MNGTPLQKGHPHCWRMIIALVLCLGAFFVPARLMAFTPGTFLSHAQYGLTQSNVLPMYYVTIEDVTRQNGYQLTAQTIFDILRYRKDGQRVIDMTNLLNVKLKPTNCVYYDDDRISAVSGYVAGLLSAYSGIDTGNIAPIDVISTDFEGNFSNWVVNSQAACDAVLADNRYSSAISGRLTAAGYQRNGQPELYYVLNWNQGSTEPVWRNYHIWNSVNQVRLNEYLNNAIWNPAKTVYPNIAYFNYGGTHYNTTYGFADDNGHQGFIFGGGDGSHAGTGPSVNFYNELDQVCFSRKGPSQSTNNPPVPYYPTAMNSMRYDLNRLRTMRLTEPSDPVWPWLQFRSASDYYGSRIGNTDYYQEFILHVGLCNPNPFIFWFPYGGLGNNDKETILYNNLLRELDEVAGFADRSWISTVASPDNINNWTNNYYLTGMSAGGRNVWRITPDMDIYGSTLAEFKIADSPPTFAIGTTQITFPAGSAVYTPTAEYAPGGYWVTSPSSGTSPTISAISQCATPTFSVDGGTYSGTQSVAISCATGGVTIRYTTDGSIPTSASTQYTSALNISSTTRLRARAFKSGCTPSATAGTSYNFDATPTNFFTSENSGVTNNFYGTQGYRFTPTQDSTVTALGRAVNGNRLTQSHRVRIWKEIANKPYYELVATADITPISLITSTKYAYEYLPEPLSLASGSVYRIASVEYLNGDTWKAYGTISNHTGIAVINGPASDYGDAYPKSSAESGDQGYGAATFFTAGASQVATPTFSPDGGSFSSGQTVTISSSTSGTTIFYTTDGSEPSEKSIRYSSPINISGSTVVKARAYKLPLVPSAMATATFETCAAMTNFLRAPYNSKWTNETNAYTGNYGYKFTAQADLTVYALGRAVIGGAMNNNHTIKIWRASDNTAIASGVVSSGSSTDSLGYKYVLLGTPVSLTKGSSYYISSSEASGGDKFILNWTAKLPDPCEVSNDFYMCNHSPLAIINGEAGAAGSGCPTFNAQYAKTDRGYGTSTFYYCTTNTPPTVSLTSPGDGAKFLVNDVVKLAASASDASGVSKVEFFVDNVYKGQDTTAPYEYNWTVSASGVYSVFARVTDSDGATADTIPITVSTTAAGIGLTGLYYNSQDFTNLVYSRVDANLYQYWGTNSPCPGIAGSVFSARWTGWILPRYSEEYTFSMYADDGAIVWIDLNGDGSFDANEKVFDYWWSSASEVDGTPVTLAAGRKYAIRVDYHNQYGGGVTRLFWRSASQTHEYVPQSRLFPADLVPTVSITSPASGTVFNTPANITIDATAADSDGTITSVKFYEDGTYLGEDTSSPYSYTWNNAPIGTHVLTAVATDNYGAVGISSEVSIRVNNPPTVSMTHPLNDTRFLAGDTVTLSADAADTDGTVSKVEFFVDDTEVYEDTEAPYTYDWTMSGLTGHTIFARATDSDNKTTDSTSITVTGVSSGTGLMGMYYESASSSGVITDLKNSGIDGPISFSWASDQSPPGTAPDNYGVRWRGYILPKYSEQYTIFEEADNGCKIYIDGELKIDDLIWDGHGEESFTVDLSAGKMHEIMVEYYNWNGAGYMRMRWSSASQGKEYIPAARMYPIDIPPTVSITSPASGTVFNTPANITIDATAADSDGTISKVEFYEDGTYLGEDTSSPYSYTWNNAPVGTHVLTAVAIDSYGAPKISSQVSIRVNSPPTVSITSPSSGVVYDAAANITIDATASDTDGTISKVDFYENGNLIDTDETSPFSCSWSSVPIGTYVLTAVATDNNNRETTSAPITVYVDSVWVEDALPTGATGTGQGGDTWSWITSDPSPFTGSSSHASATVSGAMHQHYFTGATATLTPATGDKLIAYVYLDPVNTPSEVMLQWNNGVWDHRAYWGANLIDWGTNGTDSRRYMGDLPATGQWIRLEVPASQVGLEGSTIRGMAFTLYGGKATWDHGGKSR